MENKIEELEKMIVVLYQRIYKLENKGTRMWNFSVWLDELKKLAGKLR